MWELFTLASDPTKYDAPSGEGFREWLLSGNRFCRPQLATDEMYVLDVK